jgi:hypothetical protein
VVITRASSSVLGTSRDKVIHATTPGTIQQVGQSGQGSQASPWLMISAA